MKSPSSLRSAEAEALLSEAPIALEVAAARVRAPGLGAVVAMEGAVRDSEDGRPVAAITYEAYAPMAEKVIRRALDEAERRWKVRAAARHRVGVVRVGQPAVVVAAAGTHRPEAFEACRFLIDEIKGKAPIWKARYRWRGR